MRVQDEPRFMYWFHTWVLDLEDGLAQLCGFGEAVPGGSVSRAGGFLQPLPGGHGDLVVRVFGEGFVELSDRYREANVLDRLAETIEATCDACRRAEVVRRQWCNPGSRRGRGDGSMCVA